MTDRHAAHPFVASTWQHGLTADCSGGDDVFCLRLSEQGHDTIQMFGLTTHGRGDHFVVESMRHNSVPPFESRSVQAGIVAVTGHEHWGGRSIRRGLELALEDGDAPSLAENRLFLPEQFDA